jgi:hypothetical protein
VHAAELARRRAHHHAQELLVRVRRREHREHEVLGNGRDHERAPAEVDEHFFEAAVDELEPVTDATNEAEAGRLRDLVVVGERGREHLAFAHDARALDSTDGSEVSEKRTHDYTRLSSSPTSAKSSF